MNPLILKLAQRSAFLALLGFAAQLAHAGATTDGTVGAVQTLSGNFTIPQTLGMLRGANLFHSFQNFSVNSGESAAFTTTSPLQNLIARVTGAAASNINGPLSLKAASGSQPSFFFINPAGVTFGAGASVDVPAGLHISTANYLKFADGNFHADPARSSTFSAATPEAFGFLGAVRASIVLKDGMTLSSGGNESVSLIAGDIEINNAKVVTVGGNVRIAAVGQASGEVGRAGAMPAASGKLDILNGGLVAAFNGKAADSGQVTVSAGDITIDALGNGDGAGIISFANAVGSGNGGNVRVSASGNLSVLNGGRILTRTEDAGNAGNVEVSAGGHLSVMKGSAIASSAIASGNAGAVKIHAGSIAIDGRGDRAGIASETEGAGSSGSVEVTTGGDLSIVSGGKISSSSFGTGKAGAVKVDAGNIVINNSGTRSGTGIASETGGTGSAGSVEVRASGNLAILNEGRISSSTFTSGNAGSVRVSAGSLTIDGQNATDGTGIFSIARGAGDAGTVEVTTSGNVSIVNGGSISSSTFASGNAGSVRVNAGSIVLNNSGARSGTGIVSETGGTGNAGSVDVTASGHVSILNEARISSSSFASGNGGSVRVHAGSITIDRQGGVVRTGIGSITSGGTGNSGSVEVSASGSLSLLNGGEISSNTSTSGAAGSVKVGAGTLLLSGGSSINSGATEGSSGQTGNVTIAATNGIVLSNGRFSIENNATVSNPGKLAPALLSVSAPRISLENGAAITASSSGNAAAGSLSLHYTGSLTSSFSTISTNSVNGNGGGISVMGKGALVLDHSQINTSVSGAANGNGGDIGLTAPVLVLNTGFVQANTAAPKANGGEVNINVNATLSSGASLLVGGVPLVFNAGRFGYNAIQAAAPDGVSGLIQISSPPLDLSGSLASLSTQFIDFGNLGVDLCRIGEGSSLTPLGRGGLLPASSGLMRP